MSELKGVKAKIWFVFLMTLLTVVVIASCAFIGFWVAFALSFGNPTPNTARQFFAGAALVVPPVASLILMLVLSVKEYKRRFGPQSY